MALRYWQSWSQTTTCWQSHGAASSAQRRAGIACRRACLLMCGAAASLEAEDRQCGPALITIHI